MSDADNQMRGSGGETGPRPGQPESNLAPPDAEGGREPGHGDIDAESKESFPASDPPANY